MLTIVIYWSIVLHNFLSKSFTCKSAWSCYKYLTSHKVVKRPLSVNIYITKHFLMISLFEIFETRKLSSCFIFDLKDWYLSVYLFSTSPVNLENQLLYFPDHMVNEHEKNEITSLAAQDWKKEKLFTVKIKRNEKRYKKISTAFNN